MTLNHEILTKILRTSNNKSSGKKEHKASPFIPDSPAVEFCGYTVPHPMEKKIHVRVQTSDTPALQVLLQALKDLKKQNEEISKKIKVSDGMNGSEAAGTLNELC